MGVDHRRDRVGGVVKSVHEFEAERDQQGDAEEDERQIGLDRRAGLLDVAEDAPGHEGKAQRDDPEVGQHGFDRGRLIKRGLRMLRTGADAKIGTGGDG
jgi:hypothetical protein